jgi:hypothetical protein
LYENDDKFSASLKPAREFVESQPFSSNSGLDALMTDLEYLLKHLEEKTTIPVKYS